MNPSTVGNTLRTRSPNVPRRNMRDLEGNSNTTLHVSQRRRHPTGGGGGEDDVDAQIRPLTSWTDAIPVVEEPHLEESSVALTNAERSMGDGVDSTRLIPPAGSNGSCLSGGTTADNADVEDLRKKLAFFFMDPKSKFLARRHMPWKLILQMVKIVIVTSQVCIFGSYRYAHTKYYTDNQIALEHLFLKGWDSVREIHGYPPATGVYAIYEKPKFYDYFNFISQNYYNLEEMAVNPVFKNSSFDFCINKLEGGGHVYSNLTWDIDFANPSSQYKCISIPLEALSRMDSEKYLVDRQFDVQWDTLTLMHINFTIKTVTFTKLGPLVGPECFVFYTKIVFDNSDYDGQIPITLTIEPSRISCQNPVEGEGGTPLTSALNYTVMLTCCLSFILCLRALIRAQLLRRYAERTMKAAYKWEFSVSEKLDFFNVWYIIILINDVLIIVGSIIKEMIESRNVFSDLWDFCSVFLGVGILLVWIGMLRYLGFFKAYNVLILTMKGAIPNVMRFLLCASFIYVGFVFCGWLIIGPYNFKFKTLLSSSECLFSLVNGDDMFATFSSVPTTSSMVWAFSRIYLYIFISLFIYVILSLFIAIIMDTYEIIKEYYKNGFPKERLHEFYKEANYDPSSGIFRIPSGSPLITRVIRRISTRADNFDQGGNGDAFSSDQTPILT